MRTPNLAVLAAVSLTTLAALGSAGCAADLTTPVVEPSFEEARSSLTRDASPDASPAELGLLAEGQAALAMKLYGLTAAASEGNLFFSPYSVSTALTMTYAGARGDTAAEMARALELRLPADRVHVAMNAVDLALASRAKETAPERSPFVLRSINTTFGQKGFPFEAPFLDTLARSYGAGVQLADFKGRPDAERVKINEWVAKATERKIEDLLAPGVVSTNTRLVLVNAVYFNADWATPFEKEATRDEAFTSLSGAQVSAPTMHSTLRAGYAETEAAQVLELPYAGGKVSMVVVLPKGELRGFERGFDGKALLSAMAGLKTAEVVVSLPKWQIAGDALSLRKPLGELGMSKAFGDGADFSGIVAPSVDRLFISDVLHKAFVRVDEKGTEAAAATAVVMADTAAPMDPPKVFKANRPFLFFVRDVPTNTVLFAGRMATPK